MTELRRWLLGLAAALAFAAPAAAEPPLWLVEGQHGRAWLFGSMHALPPGEFAIRGALAEAWAEAGQLVLEIDFAALSPLEVATATAGLAIDPAGRDLFELLGPDAERVRAAAAAAGLELGLLAAFEPWFAGITVAALALERQGFLQQHGVEQLLLHAAAADGKPTAGLETLTGQLGMLDGLPERLQHALLLQSLEDAPRAGTELRELVAHWRAGDVDALAAKLDEEFAEEPELAERLVHARNRRWADQVEALLAGPVDSLVVVGALHLVGEEGLPALLARRGLRVTRR